jgi:hypothetical protein
VGGDAWEKWYHVANRFLCIVMPCFFILFSLTLKYLFELVKDFLEKRVFRNGKFTRRLEGVKNYLFILLILFLIFRLHGGISAPLGSLLAASGIHVNDDKEIVKFGLQLKKITTEEAKIAVVWAGAIPYFSGRNCIDLLGYNDEVIAHKEVHLNSWKDFYPGHNKYDYSYSIRILKPDIVAQMWGDQEEILEYLGKKYLVYYLSPNKIFLRENSPNIKWNKITLQAQDQ